MLPANLIRLLLQRAGIEQNPGPWFCALCSKKLATRSVQCTKCQQWLHIKCSPFTTSKERLKHPNWIGDCCSSHTPPPQPPPSPPHSPPYSPPHSPLHSPPHSPPCSPSPPPQQPDIPDIGNLVILQFNINGISNKLDELLHYMEKKAVLIAAIQETKLNSKSKIKNTPNYTLVHRDREKDKGGGVAFLVHKDINFTLESTPPILDQDSHLESITISVSGVTINNQDQLYIRNIYIPPQSSCSQGYSPPLNNLYDNLGESSIVIGDANAHHELWLSGATNDPRGNLLVETISGLNYGIINEDLPTRVTNLASTAPDISLATSNLIPTITWKTEITLSSDHLPILISLTADYDFRKNNSKHFTYINFSKADWPGFKDYTEFYFSRARKIKNVHEGEKYFRKIVNEAASQFIPAGRIPQTYNALPTATARLIDERDGIRNQDPGDIRLHDLNKEINKNITDHRRKKWEEHLSTCDPGSKQLWNTIKGLGDKPIQPDNQSISFNNRSTIDAKDMANNFNKQYTPTIDKKPEQVFRNILRRMKKKPKHNRTQVVFTPAQVQEAIRKAKSSKAIGPDGISPIMLKNLGPHGFKFLSTIYNKSMKDSVIPNIWKTAQIIPLLKPGKPADQGTSFRPVSILPPPIKILEALLLPKVNDAVELADHQHGFRKGRSTITALQSIKDHVTDNLNIKKPVRRTVSVAIDLSKAFDTVDHQLLLQEINSLPLNYYIKRFLCNYLRGRKTYVVFRNSKSKCRKVRQGVPQGGVLSPVLFNLYMSSMPAPPGNIKLVSYADDSNILNSGTKIDVIVDEVNSYLNTLDAWFKSRNLFISPSKSSATLFTTFSNECSTVLDVKIDGQTVPTVKKPKILGITFDNLLSFNQHVSDLKTKLQSKNNILKALTGSSWGKDKEVIVNTYKAISQSVLNYACPIWTPSLRNTNSWNSLQTAQNSALRIATGCHLMADIDHLHNETKVMKVKPHCEMLSKQFLLSTQRPNHPNRVDWDKPPPPPGRLMKRTLVSEYGEEIRGISTPDLPDDTYKSKLREIHTKSVSDAINNMNANKVINTAPPAINVTEKLLPRSTRATLSQLRSGYSNFLNSYKSRINPEVQDRCPNCTESHTTSHLFNCRGNPTTLRPLDLWEKPLDAARFLNLARTDDDPGREGVG